MSFPPLGSRRSRGSREGKRMSPFLHLAQDDKERASSIDEQRIDGTLGIALLQSKCASNMADIKNLAVSNVIPLASKITGHELNGSNYYD
ncbi:cytochrome c biogenesis FN [Cucumis melo var. makuwa]|uniref:Cytochrome c biogenesis FN (Mitochondrion) n=1 Tax=Cucumis melo var. makuwa TaxID=1194695 RepID=A0A5D3C9J3_CUCMM|nr:cytochrome c biogenesis FN [Cucumis melo var. makuwa]